MLISPPFLTDKTKENEILDTGLQPVGARDGSSAPEGNFPISQSMIWHTGTHLQAPSIGNGGYAPVRAIADGKIIFVNAPRARVDDADDGQAYNPFGSKASWTDNGMVIIEHETEIGADGDTATVVKFYSGYMHLSEIAKGLAAGKSIYRKDILGKPGVIYDRAGQIELSIACNSENVRKLTGRETQWQDSAAAPTADGRIDAIFGNLYVYLPATTPISTAATAPTAHVRSAYQGGESLGEAQWVRIDIGNGGATLGSCVLSTYNTAGVKTGASAAETDFEYKLCAEAAARHKSAVKSGAKNSSQGGWYELLRFGRNVGRGADAADKDPLPADAMHWRRIKTVAGADVWADLNAQGTFKFSDADFLPVMGWNCYYDDTQFNEQRCRSDKLKDLIADPDDPESKSDDDKLAKRIGHKDVLPKLARTICRFPNEWDKATLETRYKFMSERPDIQANPESWAKAKKHLEAMGLDGLPDDFKNADWHFHPAEFIRHFSKCIWLNNRELAQCFPRKHMVLSNAQMVTSTVSWKDALSQAQPWTLPFNKATRKYGIANTKQRMVHYFAHVIPETGFLKLMKEGDNKTGTYLKGKSYWPYYGRGLIQLTWLKTYKDYGGFRGFAHTVTTGTYADLGWDPDVMIAHTNADYNAVNCADSACWYVANRAGMLKKMDNGIAQTDAVAVSKCVNGDVAIQNLNGLEVRLQSILFLRDTLLDRKADALTESMTFNWRRNSSQEPTGEVNAKGKPIKKFILRNPPWEIQVQLEKQRP